MSRTPVPHGRPAAPSFHRGCAVGGAVPVLDLPEAAIEGDHIVPGATLAAMLYPADKRGQDHWFAAAMVGAFVDRKRQGASPEVLSLYHDWMAIAWDLKQGPRRVMQDGLVRMKRGLLAGYVLKYLVVTARHHPKHCSVEKAKVFTVEFPPWGHKVSESLVEKSWAEFKTVSHFWAAMHEMIPLSDPGGLTEDTAWLGILGVAEAYRRKGEEARVLVASKMWTVPEGRAPEAELVVSPLPEGYLAFMDSMFPDL
jgi:hypothetical protein